MKQFIRYILLLKIILLQTFVQGQNQGTYNLPYLNQIESLQISNKSEREIKNGCLVTSMTEGEFVLDSILTNSTFSRSNKRKLELCASILQVDNLYYLHNRAGFEIWNSIESHGIKDIAAYVDVIKLDYVLLRIIISTQSDVPFIRLGNEQLDAIYAIIGNANIGERTQRYFIEALYSLTIQQKTGKLIHDKLNELILTEDQKRYNDNLFTAFQLYKPILEKLNKIRTWREMDKKFNEIQNMFTKTHPIMFLQLLSFNPSTVLESKKLCEAKQNALLDLLKNADNKSFYYSLRLEYLIELLFDRNYSVRFLDQLMTKSEKQSFIKNLELNKY